MTITTTALNRSKNQVGDCPLGHHVGSLVPRWLDLHLPELQLLAPFAGDRANLFRVDVLHEKSVCRQRRPDRYRASAPGNRGASDM